MLTNYQQIISEATGVTDPTDLKEIEEYMRECIWHSTLDWQTREQLASSAVVAWNECQLMRNMLADPSLAPPDIRESEAFQYLLTTL